eukprot:g2781.t1
MLSPRVRGVLISPSTSQSSYAPLTGLLENLVSSSLGKQAECLETGSVLDGESIVYCAPTSAGKSLVSEILMLRRLHSTGKAAMLILPFVALCTEKSHQLDQLLRPINKQIKRFYGTHNSRIIISESTGILVCTIEKANLLVNHMIEDDLVQLLSTVVVDELHMIDDQHRGYLLEIILTKLRFIEQKQMQTELQIIGMSATMPNAKQIAQWLNAALYITQTRPVPLKQYLKIGSVIHDEQGKIIRELNGAIDRRKDPDHIACLAKETVDDGHSVLIFCCSKRACENCAQQISTLLTVPFQPKSATGINRDSIVLELRSLSSGCHPVLAEVIPKGVAFHHAGLSSEERALVELAYKSGVVSILTATSTLAAGVNLPARRVIFKEPYVGLSSNVLDPTKYRQMAGRAGRAGIDQVGEAFLLESKYVANEKLQRLIQADAQFVRSCLLNDKGGLTRLLLEAICSGAAKTGQDIERLIQNTLLAHMQDSDRTVVTAAKTSLSWLVAQQLIFWEAADRWNDHRGQWSCTPLGAAIVNSGMHPEDSALVKVDLQNAMQHLVLASDLHLTFLVTPYNIEIHIDWCQFYFMFNSLSVTDTRIADLVGVNMVFVQGQYKGVECEDLNEERNARRFYAAMILRDLINEIPLSEICHRFDVTAGTVESLQEKSHRYATMTAAFCASLGWTPLKAMIEEFQKRIYGGARPEIVHLTKIPFVKSRRARALYKAGFRTVESLATTDSEAKVAEALFSDHRQDLTPRELGIARKIIRNAKVLIRRHLSLMEEETKTAAEIVGDENSIHSETSLECFYHDLESINQSVSSESKNEPNCELELSSNLRRLSFQITPFHTAEGIVYVRSELELKSLQDYLRTSNTGIVGLGVNSKGLAMTWSAELVVYICVSEMDLGSHKDSSLVSLLKLERFQKGVFGLPESIDWIPSEVVSSLLDLKTAGRLIGVTETGLESLASFCTYLNCEEDYNRTLEWISSASQSITSGDFETFTECLEAALSRIVLIHLRRTLEEMKLWELFINLESPVAGIMQQIAVEGILFDRTRIKDYLVWIHDRLDALREACEVLGGIKDPSSLLSKHLKEKLEQTIGLVLPNWNNEKTECNEILLRSLQDDHPLPAAILEYRKLSKQEQYLNSVLLNQQSDNVRISPCVMFEMRYMKTGVNSLQSLPIQEVTFSHGHVWMSDEDSSSTNLTPIHCVVPRENFLLIVGEFLDLDLSLLSELSHSNEITEAMRQCPLDPFQALAASWLKGSISITDQVTQGEVYFCRKFIHGFLEGVSPLLCARQLRIGEKRSKETSKGLMERFTELQTWIERLRKEVDRGLGVRTLYGRQMPVWRTGDPQQVARLAIRSVVQGSISDIFKLALIYTKQKIQNKLQSYANLLLQEQQYVVMEVHKTKIDDGVKILRESMEAASEMTVPVLIELHVGQSWVELKNHQAIQKVEGTNAGKNTSTVDLKELRELILNRVEFG